MVIRERHQQTGRTRHIWENNIKINLENTVLRLWTGFMQIKQRSVASYCDETVKPVFQVLLKSAKNNV